MRTRAASAVLLLILNFTPSPSQAQTTEAELRSATEELYKAALAIRSVTTPPALLQSASWLRDSARQAVSFAGPLTKASDVSTEYLRSLQSAAELLRKKPSAQVVNDIAEDLLLKVEHCRDLNIGMGGTIKVVVNTRRGDGSIRNLQVKYLLKFYEATPGAEPGTFGRLSSPTDASLPPGRYWIWAVDPASGRSSARTLVRVAGQRELVVDVPVG